MPRRSVSPTGARPEPPVDPFLTVDEVLGELRVSRSTFHTWRTAGDAPDIVTFPGGVLRVRRSALDRWLTEHTASAAPGVIDDGATTEATVYDVEEIVRKRADGSRFVRYRVRWMTARRPHTKTYRLKGLARTRQAELLAAAKRGTKFDVATGLPVTELARIRTTEEAARAATAAANAPTWYSHAGAFARMRWPEVSDNQRRSIAESLATVTPALFTDEGRGSSSRPPADLIRAALYGWAFVPGRRYLDVHADVPGEGSPPERLAPVLAWLARHTVPIIELSRPDRARAALHALSRKLDGQPAAANTVLRKRAVLYGCLGYAVSLGHLPGHPLDGLAWTMPRSTGGAVDRRCVVNAEQAAALLGAVEAIEPRLTAWYGCMYGAAMRPEECQELRDTGIEWTDGGPAGWGWLVLAGANPGRGRQWTDSGERAARGLKHRAPKETRRVPASPELLARLRSHLDRFGTTPDGRLFRASHGGPVTARQHGEVWQAARLRAFTATQYASPLADRPYDLRAAAVSRWLDAGVSPQLVASWAGHSLAVLFRVYAQILDGGEQAAIRRLAAGAGR